MNDIKDEFLYWMNRGYYKSPFVLQHILKALDFAERAHRWQWRKYSHEPYVNHPIRVAYKVWKRGLRSEEIVCAALLHDVVEDCGITVGTLKGLFGIGVSHLVDEVSDKFDDPKYGNRHNRKELELLRLSGVSDNAKAIKLADMLDNLPCIVENDPKFGDVYFEEKKRLFDAIKGIEQNRYLETEVDYMFKELSKKK